MNTEEKISVIIPCYNIAQYIERAVLSVTAQTYKNLEIILVDDGSTDGTDEILDKISLSDDRIVVIHKENGGVTSARFCGIEAATGEWIGFVDGDDYVEPEMFEILISNAKKYGADISHCGYQMVFPSRVDLYYGTGRLADQDRETCLKDLLSGSFVEPGLCNKLYNNSLLHSLFHSGKMDFTVKNNEDLLMNFYLFKEAKKSVFIDNCYYHYLVRKGSAATSIVNENKLSDTLKVFKIIKKETEGNEELQNIMDRRIVAQLIGLATMQYGKQKELIRPYRKSARRELHGMLSEIVKGKYPKQQKLMALWASAWPWSYGVVHSIYSKIKGTDKKYEVK